MTKLDFDFNKEIMDYDPIMGVGKAKIKAYFSEKLNQITKELFEFPEFEYSGIKKDSISFALANASLNGYSRKPVQEVSRIDGLSLYYDKDLNKYCIAATLITYFDYDPANKAFHEVMRLFNSMHAKSEDCTFMTTPVTGEYFRSTAYKDKIKFACEVKVMLDPEDIKWW